MKHRRIRTILMLLLAALLLLSSCSTFVFAAESDVEEGSSLISEKNLKNATNQQNPAAIEKIEKTAKNYDLDKEDKFGIDNVGATVGHMLSSVMYKASRGMGYYGAYLTKFSIDFDLFTKCKVFLSKPFANLKAFTMNSFASQIGLLFIACTLAVVVFLLIKGQVASGMGKLAQIIAVMLIAMFFFTEPLPFLRDANTLAKEFGLAVFEYTQEEADGTDAAVETIWETVAVNPWLLLEFDDMSPSTKAKVENEEKEEYKLLHLKPEEDERKDAADALADTYRPLKSEWSPQSDRMGTAFLLMLMNLVLFLIIVAINLFMLGLQVLTLVLGLVTPFVFILALFPGKGMNVIKNWALALLGAYMGIALSLFAYGIFLMLLNLVYGQLMAELGVFLSFVVILSFILMVWVFRRKLLGIFGDTSSLDRFESRAERKMMQMYMHHRHSSSALPAKRVTHTVAQRTERGEATTTTRAKSRQRQKAALEDEAQKKGGQMTKRPTDQAGRNMQQDWKERIRVRTYSGEEQTGDNPRDGVSI